VASRAPRREGPARPRPFYNAGHTYISFLLAAGAKPLFVCRQTGTTLEMIGRHYGDARVAADELDELIGEFTAGARTTSEIRNPPGTLPDDTTGAADPDATKPLNTKGFRREPASGIEPATSSLEMR
jgi:hypothetical protein